VKFIGGGVDIRHDGTDVDSWTLANALAQLTPETFDSFFVFRNILNITTHLLPIMIVRECPPRLSFNNQVSDEFLNE